jgi:hypothetical protein
VGAKNETSQIQRYFRVELDQLAYLRFVLEGYEGLVVLTSLPGRAEVQWTVPAALAAEAETLARELAKEITLAPIPRPLDWPDGI